MQFQDGAGNVSEIHTDSIILDTSAGSSYGLSINEGALFATSTAVVLLIPTEGGTAEMQVSNDGGFQGVEWEPYSLYKDWQITSFGNYVIPRTVYARFRDTVGHMSSVFQDDIILDPVAPSSEITELKLSGDSIAIQSTTVPVTVRWTGSDDNSGVKWYDVQVRTDDGAWTDWLIQTTDTDAIYPAKPSYVYHFRSRAQDNAGNWEEYTDGDKFISIPKTVYLPLISNALLLIRLSWVSDT